MVEPRLDTIEIIAVTVWTAFVTYATWYFTSAKYSVPLSVDEARMLWRIHKRHVQCDATRWREVKQHGKTIGFECECGFKHLQKRNVVAGPPAAPLAVHARSKRLRTRQDDILNAR